jgi:hypothetical protein
VQRKWPTTCVLAALSCVALSGFAASQARTPSHVIILPMANVSKPSELDFEGGACDVDGPGDTMKCAFQQVFIRPPLQDDPAACVIVTNRYEQTFKKQNARRWVNNDGPAGVCGVVVVTTLEQEEGDLISSVWRVTLNTRKIVTNKAASPGCSDVLAEMPETLSWNYRHRALSCEYIRAASIGE